MAPPHACMLRPTVANVEDTTVLLTEGAGKFDILRSQGGQFG